MRKFLASAIMICFVLLLALSANSSVIIPSGTKSFSSEEMYNKIASLKIKELQQFSERKLTLKEKIGFLFLKHQLKHRTNDEKVSGNTAFTMALIGLGLLVLGLFVPYIIVGSIAASILAIALGSSAYKEDHSDRKAHTAKIIGWLTLGTIVLTLLLAVIVIATFSWL